ncbi:deazaflavin-dependent oxidoreductase (nitroreductase family) [Murinocardiopsis flavida]|uniref:Deazaflavin-dependent oxidoreductase (Nitroreductase family) n=1 Tax=Murinocardiopsis flavida TaxID=645275 RepID=A0A2P8DPE2_9ACTN|nr:nitroreductase family deazaflavin-dependent oxidoreductase [Murinocardiopsis flavida]PSK99078.1 deazaflavin-dependent oxidoreductase (nitroreductase family) [Murinocardiopsis flavida]
MTARNGPTGVLRLLFRAPVWIYRAGLGGLLGHRFLLLTHIGRVSGQPRQTVLEVADRDPGTGEVTIASGFGGGAQWLRNITAQPRVRFQIGRTRVEAVAELLPPEESGRRLAAYADRYPRTAAALVRGLGHTPDGAADYRAIGADRDNGIPLVVLRPL